MRVAAARSQDMGMSRWVALLLLLPLVGAVVFLVLLFKPSAPAQGVLASPATTA